MNFLIAENKLLEWVVGSDPNATGTPKLQWANMPESWGVLVLIAVVAAVVFGVFWMYRREINTCPMPIKLVMGGLRLAVLLLLIAMYLKPSIFYQQVNEIKPTVAWLRDSSLSFDRGDNYRSKDQADLLAKITGLSADDIASGQIKRSALLNQAFKKNPELLEKLRDKGSIRVINFSDGNSPVAMIPAIAKKDTQADEDEGQTDDGKTDTDAESESLTQETMPELEANGLGTDIWQALRESLDDASRLSSVVLISDGQHNGTEDPLEIARKAASLGIPIFVVGVGDPNPPKNLAVTEVYVREKAYPDEPFEIEAILQTSQVGDEGMPPSIDVQLVQQRVDRGTGKLGAPQSVKSRAVDVPTNGGRIRVDFDHILNQPGKYVYTIQVDALEDETETEDNSLVSSEMEVVDEKVRVLLVAGLPSWDYQQVQRLLQRDQTISLSCWLQSMDETRPQEGNESISRLPRTRQEMAEYNVIIMMDPNSEEFDADWMDNLKEFCKTKAGGLLFMSGPQFTSEFVTMNRLKGIRDLLPVRFGDIEFIDTVEVLTSAKGGGKPGKMLLVNHNMDHPVMSFRSDPAETQKIWNLMPGIYWSFPTLTPKPTARVLLERGDQVNSEGNQPLMVAGRYGAGSVLYMGFQGTWRWRPLGVQAQYFDRFWIQVVRYLVETRSLQGSRRGFIDAEKTEFELGDRVVLVGRVLDEEFRPSMQEVHKAMIRSDDGRSQTVDMKLLPNQEGRYEGTFVAQRIGNYQATIQLGDPGGEEKLIDPIAFRVVPPTAESGAYWLNEKLLSEIATQSGGQYFHLDQLDQVAASLPTLVTRAEFNSPPKPLWDGNSILRWFMFGLPVLLLTIEWVLRKWYKLL
ncbi:MAG: VWA domain-containing protein [Mariniblastus sp.]|nr:VWA domain-containing protein [Mariniblastus sp.]